MAQTGPLAASGEGRDLVSGASGPLRLELRDDDLTIALGTHPLDAAYRDVTTAAVQQGQLLLVLGGGAAGEARFIVDRLGDRLGALVATLRDRRARQLLADRLIELSASEAIELVEYRAGAEHGVAQLAFHAWGAALMPLDERRRWRLVRRAEIDRVTADAAGGTLAVATRRGDVEPAIELLGLGAGAERMRQRFAALSEGALADAAGIVGRLLPDAPFGIRRQAAVLLVDGRPVERGELGEAWPAVESAVLSEPTFAEAYRALAERGRGPAWIALAPLRPGAPEHVAWFFVGLPGNLVAMEMVSEGAHATYLFRVVPRGEYVGEPPAALGVAAAAAVAQVSDALIDMRFLRSALYLRKEQLADARHLRQRLAIAALPSVQAARARFVGRLIHRGEEAWQRGLDEAIAWSAAARDDAEQWPGSAAAEDDTSTEPTTIQPTETT